MSREKPLKWNLKFFGDKIFDNQGRIIHAEYEDYHVIGVYVPNSGRDLVNLSMRKDWEDQLLEKLQELDESKPVIYAGNFWYFIFFVINDLGDLNVAHNEIDLKNPEANRNKTAGFTDQERNDFTRMLAAGFTDTWRTMNPKKVAYTYFSYFSNCRAKNVGWRLDYFVISDRIYDKVTSCEIHKDEGSDHVPISLTIRLWSHHVIIIQLLFTSCNFNRRIKLVKSWKFLLVVQT